MSYKLVALLKYDTQSHKLIIHDFELLVVTSIILYNHAELNEVLLLNITAKQLEH